MGGHPICLQCLLCPEITEREEEVLPLVTMWLDLENIMQSKMNQLEKAKNHVSSLTGGI